MKIVLLGTANPYRGGGISTFNERLALEFQNKGHVIVIYNFLLQYPNFLFPGKTQYDDNPPASVVRIYRKVNSINPFNWIKVGIELYRLRPDMIIFRYWISFMAPCFSVIAWIAKRNNHTKIFTIVDNAISHEPKFYETILAKLFFSVSDSFLTMSQKVMDDMKRLTVKIPSYSLHPLYDNYSPVVPKQLAREKLGLTIDESVILFFGFIREYKGLDLLIEAMSDSKIKNKKIKLIIAGEFYSNGDKYASLAKRLDLEDSILWHTNFIPNEQIANFFGAADAVILPYKSATQSGVTQVAFYYHTPIIATNVGGIQEMVEDHVHGLIIDPTVESISNAIITFYDQHLEEPFRHNIERDKIKFSWDAFTEKILSNV